MQMKEQTAEQIEARKRRYEEDERERRKRAKPMTLEIYKSLVSSIPFSEYSLCFENNDCDYCDYEKLDTRLNMLEEVAERAAVLWLINHE
jgi:sulfatase maturation enzyme AslB (radical SAM superfamily)